MARQSTAAHDADNRNFHEISASQWPGLAMDATADIVNARSAEDDRQRGSCLRVYWHDLLSTPRSFVKYMQEQRQNSCRAGGARH